MASSSYKEIAEALAFEVKGIAGIGRVHTFQRATADWDKYLDLFAVEGPEGDRSRILGWMISRERATEELGSFAASSPGGFLPAGMNRRVHHFLVLGFMGLKDEAGTELEFQDLIEAICDRFRSDTVLRLARNVASVERLTPPQVEIVEPRTFGGVLCHYTEIRIQAIERIARAT